jgi:quercetin dioxygenase-like cupin family protein
MRRASTALVAALLLLGACGSDSNDGSDTDDAERVVSLLDAAEQTILGQPLSYPDTGQAQVSSVILTLQPGEDTGWHHHDAPLYAHILDGAVTVDYGEDGERTYEAGQAFMEAVGTSHNGRTEGSDPVRILVVNIGAAGTENTVTD